MTGKRLKTILLAITCVALVLVGNSLAGMGMRDLTNLERAHLTGGANCMYCDPVDSSDCSDDDTCESRTANTCDDQLRSSATYGTGNSGWRCLWGVKSDQCTPSGSVLCTTTYTCLWRYPDLKCDTYPGDPGEDWNIATDCTDQE